jgi:hypothetical protein
MKSISLRTLLREPLKVKRLTRTGKPVQVTDNGKPLWILNAVTGTDADEAERRRAVDELLNELLDEKPSPISLSKILDESRR